MGGDIFFPRVLVLANQVPHLGSPSAIVLYRLFENWPADRLLAIGPEYHVDATRLSCRYETWNDPWERVERTRFKKSVRTFRVIAGLSAFNRRRLFAKLGEFRPDVVVSLMEFQRFYAGAWRFAQAIHRPLVLLVHDLAESFEMHFAVGNGAQRWRDRAIYRGAKLRLPVSDPMEKILFQRYGAHGTVLLPIPSSDPVNARTSPPAARDVFLVGYAGSLDSRYEAVLRPLAAALEGGRIRLNIYSRSAPPWPMGANTIYRGHFVEPEDLWLQVQAECNVLLFAFGPLDARDEGIIRYSFPSKMTEYLRLGLPIIMAAPDYSAVRRWATAHEDAFLFASPEAPTILEQLSRLRDDPALRARLGGAARRLYDRDFTPAAMRERFRGLLVDVSGPGAD